MKLTIIKDDGVVGINGAFKTIDLSGLPPGVRALQWNETSGHIEYDDDATPNMTIENINDYQIFVERWNKPPPEAPAPTAPTAAEMIAAAQALISAAYEANVDLYTAGYPADEVSSWPKQEAEARAWLADNNAPTPWIDAAATTRAILKADLINKIIGNADALAPIHGALTGKRQFLRDAIKSLGANATQEQLDAYHW